MASHREVYQYRMRLYSRRTAPRDLLARARDKTELPRRDYPRAMLHSMRRRMREMAEGEARGESYWSERFAGSVRVRIMRKVDAIEERGPTRAALFVEARREILDEAGMDFLATPGLRPFEDFAVFWRDCDDELFPTVIEAFIKAVRNWEQKPDWPPRRELAPDFIAVANEILAQERVAWKIVNDQMVEMKSQELHEAVVEPALRLLHDARFSAVDATYRKALDELSRGDGGDAITDAGAALQELLSALGCQGNQLGDLIRSAKGKGLLAAHDTPPLVAVEKAIHWVAADRSQMGESHHASDATRDDAWLIVHVVGSFIVRLAVEESRRTDRLNP